MLSKEQGKDKAVDASDKIIYKVDVPANRYCVLSMLSVALSQYSVCVCVCVGTIYCAWKD